MKPIQVFLDEDIVKSLKHQAINLNLSLTQHVKQLIMNSLNNETYEPVKLSSPITPTVSGAVLDELDKEYLPQILLGEVSTDVVTPLSINTAEGLKQALIKKHPKTPLCKKCGAPIFGEKCLNKHV